VFLRRATQLTLGCLTAILIVGCSSDRADTDPAAGTPFVISGGPGPATVWAIGDAGHLGERERPVARLIAGANADRLLYLGDVYETGTAEEFEAYDTLYGRLAPVTAPTPGNHEWPNHDEGYDPYWARQKGRPPPSYYSFTIAGWKIVSVNSQLFSDETSEQVSWLRREVAGPGNCRLAFWHVPRYSAGTTEGHGDEPGVDPLWQAVEGRAALVVNGHEHNMQRLWPRNGIVELIAGAGGHARRYALAEDDPRLAFADADHDGALRMRLSRGRAKLDFVAAGGKVLDSSVVRCRED
jgi:hypothetical protein